MVAAVVTSSTTALVVGHADARPAVTDSSTGQAVVGWADDHGYHISTIDDSGRADNVAVLRPDGIDAGAWTGYQCVTPDGRYAAVTVAPQSFANSPALRQHGAWGYGVNLRTGHVWPLVSNVKLAYHTPGCGSGDRAVFTSETGGTDDRTVVTTAQLRTGNLVTSRAVVGQVTSAVPTGDSSVGVRDGELLSITQEGAHDLARVGDAYDLAPDSRGGVDFLTTRRRQPPSAFRWNAGRVTPAAVGDRIGTVTRSNPAALAAAAPALRPSGASSVAAVRTAATSADRHVEVDYPAQFRVGVFRVDTNRSSRTIDLRRAHEPAAVTATGPAVTGHDAATGAALDAVASTPACAVPRNDPQLQSLQPNAAQIDWAIDMATQGRLTGSLARPAGYANMGQSSYAANSDFPPISLANPSGSGATTVPPLVFEAIAAQESNFAQASWHALPGIAGNPLIADYYGTGGNAIDSIDYTKSDCGYGVSQVTDGMHAGDTDYTAQEQDRIAVDYEENVAAGLNILQRTWNQLASDGITANDGSPAHLENWYFATWAYNTGIHPTGPDGTAGLGWANNPANPDYPPDRAPYLQQSYADAAHPASWPYQERVMGWMASPLVQHGQKDYTPAVYRGGNTWLQIPPRGIACSATNYCTPPGGPGTPGCSLQDSECWWTGHATWVNDCTDTCAVNPTTVLQQSTEPTVADPHPPTCNLNGDVPSTSAGSPIVVDDLARGAPLNLVGCPTHPNWTNRGSFDYQPGTAADGQPVGDVDTHQLGVGFGGHILFSHLESTNTPELINNGTWSPDLSKKQYYDIRVHVPATGADATAARYTLVPATGAAPIHFTLNQHVGEAWINAGSFGLAAGATLTLSNAGSSGLGTTDVAWDAVAFVPQGGKPTIDTAGVCPDFDFVAARGSGQPGPGKPRWAAKPGSKDPYGMGGQLAPIAQRFAQTETHHTVLQTSIGYLADNVYDPRPPSTYFRDLDQGVALTLAHLRQQYSSCGTKEHYVLAGYSQGAMVIHRAMATLDSSTSSDDRAIARLVDAVVLVADGDRKRGDDISYSGTAPHDSQGVSWEAPDLATPPDTNFPTDVGRRVLSICDQHDYVCDFPVGASKTTIAKWLVPGVHIHLTHYKTAAEDNTYVDWIETRTG